MINLKKWSDIKNKVGYMSILLDNKAQEMGFTRDNLTFESMSGNIIAHGFIKGKKGIVLKGNCTNGKIELVETNH